MLRTLSRSLSVSRFASTATKARCVTTGTAASYREVKQESGGNVIWGEDLMQLALVEQGLVKYE
jgi:hypothetical protein